MGSLLSESFGVAGFRLLAVTLSALTCVGLASTGEASLLLEYEFNPHSGVANYGAEEWRYGLLVEAPYVGTWYAFPSPDPVVLQATVRLADDYSTASFDALEIRHLPATVFPVGEPGLREIEVANELTAFPDVLPYSILYQSAQVSFSPFVVDLDENLGFETPFSLGPSAELDIGGLLTIGSDVSPFQLRLASSAPLFSGNFGLILDGGDVSEISLELRSNMAFEGPQASLWTGTLGADPPADVELRAEFGYQVWVGPESAVPVDEPPLWGLLAAVLLAAALGPVAPLRAFCDHRARGVTECSISRSGTPAS